MSDVIVVGAGMGGLASAVRLASQGVAVHVIEAASRPGGKAATEMLDGVEVDTGPSVVTLPEVFDTLLRDAGTSLRAQVRLRTPEPAFRYQFPDGATVDLFHDRGASLDAVGRALGAEARRDLDRFLEYAERVWSAGAPHFVFARAPTMTTLLRLGTTNLAALRDIDALRSMRGAIWNRVRNPHLRNILLRYATYNGSDPRCAPATLNCIAWVELGLGGYGIEGGVYALIEAFERIARECGARFSYDTKVEQIIVRRGRVTGVRTSRGTFDASHVIANADAASVSTDLLAEQRARGPAIREPLSTSAVNAIVARNLRRGSLPAHTVVFPENYEQEFADLFDHARPPADPTVYACAQAAAHGRKTWPDREPVFLMANAPSVPPGSTTVAAPKTPPMEQLEQRLVGRAIDAGLLEATDPVLWRRDPFDLARRFPGSRGALYGSASNDRFAAFHRPPNRMARVAGLYLASGSAHPGGGLPLCALSGRHAADETLRDLGLRGCAP